MTLKEVIKAINGISNINSNIKIKDIKTDSRKINKGDLFIAIKGDKYNGHNFIDEAIKNGAYACISEERLNDKCILVKSTIKSLYLLGSYFRNKYNIPLIAITGSNGKTTTKDLIAYILSSKYKVLKSLDSKNNVIGITDTLFKLNNKHNVIVMELGSNHIGEISYLSKLCKPDTSVITNIGSSHLKYFKTRKNIFKEKTSILNGMNSNNLIINGDDKYLGKLEFYKCGEKENNNLIAYNVYEDINFITFSIYLDKEYKIKFNNPGKHFITDILLAIKVCLDYKIDINTIIKRISKFKLTNKRMNIIKYKTNVIINDCYNSSLESIKAGIEYMSNIDSKKIFIIGDILELGRYSNKIHRKINKLLKNINNKEVYTVGKYSRYIEGINYKDSNELIQNIRNIENSYIYIKGSRKMNLDKVVDYLTKKSII